MINYSIVKRSVNANLIEINQAKSRINQAKKEGKTPQPADLALVKTEKQNAFAVAQYTGVMNIDKFSRHISSHGRRTQARTGEGRALRHVRLSCGAVA